MKYEKGFTLIELLVSMLLIACLIVAGIVVYKHERQGISDLDGKLTFNMNLQGEFVESTAPCPYIATYGNNKSICIDPNSNQIYKIQKIVGYSSTTAVNYNAEAEVSASIHTVSKENLCMPLLGCTNPSHQGYSTYLEIDKVYSASRIK